MKRLAIAGLCLLAFCGCSDGRAEAEPSHAGNVDPVVPAGAQRGNGKPYEVSGSEVWDVGDTASRRAYQVFVAVPRSYAENPTKRYPVLYVTDADYGFPLIRYIGRRLNGDGQKLQDFILVGLSYAVGEDSMASRRRDYTPTAAGAHDAPADAIHGKAADYMRYLRERVFPFVAARYRTDEGNRLFLGHSYGGLLGTQVLLTDPGMFSGYILGSPSLWYDNNAMDAVEKAYAGNHDDLAASVYMYVGEYEDMKPGDERFARRYNMVSDAKRLERSLRSRNYPSLRMKLEILNDEDHLSVAPRGFTHGLKYLLSAAPDRAPR